MNIARTALLAALLGLGYAGFATAADADKATKPLPPQASIPFIKHGAVQDWQADKRQGVWLRDRNKQWYYAKLMGTCIGLDYALSIGFDTGSSDTLDRFGYIIVPGEDRCPISSLSRSDAPPAARKRGKVADKPVEPAPAPVAK